MRFIKAKNKIGVLLVLISFSGIKNYSQNSVDNSLYAKFDSIVGQENSGLNNGGLHTNPYRTIGDNNMYFIIDKFSNESIVYNGHPYFNVNLKYDIYRDQVIYSPYVQSNHIAINLSQESISSFSFHKKTFVNLTHKKTTTQDFIKGFYEEIVVGSEIILYIKYKKNIKKIAGNEFTYYEFREYNNFIIKYKESFYKMDSKEEAITQFPKYKDEINNYYYKNNSMSKDNEVFFTTFFFKFLNDLLISNLN